MLNLNIIIIIIIIIIINHYACNYGFMKQLVLQLRISTTIIQ